MTARTSQTVGGVMKTMKEVAGTLTAHSITIAMNVTSTPRMRSPSGVADIRGALVAPTDGELYRRT